MQPQPPQPAPAAQPAAAGQPPPQAAQQQPPRRGVIEVPSFREVQEAERQRRAAGLPVPQLPARPAGGGGGAAAAAAAAAAPPPGAFGGGGQQAWQHPPPPQQQVWQQQPPQQQQAWQQQQPQQAWQQPPPQQQAWQPPPQQQQAWQPPPAPPPQHYQQQPYQQQYHAPPPPAVSAPPANAILVSRRQEGNPVLRHIRNVRWQWADIAADYQLGASTAAVFLSLRFHLLKPQYVFGRLRELGRSHRLRVLLCHVDADDPAAPLAEVTRAALGAEATLLCGFSAAECARYLEALKAYEHKPAEAIQKDVGGDYLSRLTHALTAVRGVNKTDVKTLGDRFGSVAGVFGATAAELQACPGIGPTKARRLHDTFHQPFRRTVGAAAAGAGAAGQQQQQQQQRQRQEQQQRQEQGGAGAEPPAAVAGEAAAGEPPAAHDFPMDGAAGSEGEDGGGGGDGEGEDEYSL